MVCSAETKLTMLLVQPRDRNDGLYLALIPADLDAHQVQEGFAEIGIDPQQVIEIGGWEKAAVGLAAAFVPLP